MSSRLAELLIRARNHGFLSCLALLSSLSTESQAAKQPHRNEPLPESLLTESATDIDADEAGELEWEANLARLGARRGGAFSTLTSVEVEWRALSQLGLRLEPTYARIAPTGAAPERDSFGVSGAVALGVWHDYGRDQHVQIELLGHTADHSAGPLFDPGEEELPVSLDLLGAQRIGRWTFRTTAGVEAGGHFAHLPLHTDLAVLTGIANAARFGYLALEVRADWASVAPLVIAPELISDLVPLGLPFRLGMALPVNVGASAVDPSYGLFFRLVLLTERERNSERGGVVSR
ncbi:MAG: hypothetical protein ABI488_25055 [Polyangiaceae bacterium]